jgi:hypothetical protein
VARPALSGSADPFELAEANGLGESTGYYPLRVGTRMAVYIGIAMLFGGATALLIVAMATTSRPDGRAVGLVILGAFAALCGVAGIIQTLREWNRAVYLFDGGFIIVTRPGAPPAVFPWPAIGKVRKRVSVFRGLGWNSYTEVDRGLAGGQVTEQVNARADRSGAARAKTGVRCSYIVWRSDGVTTWLKPEYQNVYELGEAILRNAPTAQSAPGPD